MSDSLKYLKYLDCDSHARMQQVMRCIHALYPLGSQWYTRAGDVTLTVTEHNNEGVVFVGDQGYGTCQHTPDSLLRGVLMTVEEVARIGVRFCIHPELIGEVAHDYQFP